MTDNNKDNKHTPLPWHAETLPVGACSGLTNVVLYDEKGLPVATVWDSAVDKPIKGAQVNAAFIVRACNAHYELEARVAKLERACFDALGWLEGTSGGSAADAADIARAQETLTGVLAKAKGENSK
jgi:hypothetical protein